MNDQAITDLAFNVFGQPIVVRTPAQPATWHTRLIDLMGPYNAPAPAHASEIIGVEQVADATPWHVTYDKYTNMLVDEDHLVQHLEWRIFTIGVLQSVAALSVHAGAATRAGGALLLPGLSGTGKTTLSLALASQGWQVLTDDVSLLDVVADEIIVQPCARCCHLAPDALAQLMAKHIALNGPFGDLPEYFRPAELGQPAPVRWIVAPSYAPDAELGLTRLTQAETAALLIGAGLRQTSRTLREQWAAAIKLACQAPGYRLSFPSLNAGLAALAEVTGEPLP
jgi:hypothetical protein